MSEKRRTSPILLTLYDRYLEDQQSDAFAAQAQQHYTPGTLQRLAQVGDRYRRRAAVLALSFLGDYDCNQVMGCALVDKDRGVRRIAEDGIRAIWKRAGNQHHRKRLDDVIELLEHHRYEEAASLGTELIEQAPWFAEAWNQRALAYQQLERYTDSIRDCRQALEINPYHYAAAAGMGQCYLQLNDRISALECFRRALRLNPNLEGVRAKVVYLQKSLKDE